MLIDGQSDKNKERSKHRERKTHEEKDSERYYQRNEEGEIDRNREGGRQI